MIHDPLIQRAVVLELAGAQRVGDALQRVLNGMREVIHGVDAPCIALPVVADVPDAVDDRVAQVGVAGGRINLGAQGFGAVRELAVLHALKEGKVLLHRAVAVGGFAACLGAIGSLILCEVVLGEVADVCVALPDELDGELIAFAEVIRAVENAARRLRAQPVQILADGADEFHMLLGGVCVVVAQIEQSAVLPCDLGVDADCFGGADMQVAVRLRGEPCVYLDSGILAQVLVDDVEDKVGVHVFVCHSVAPCFDGSI